MCGGHWSSWFWRNRLTTKASGEIVSHRKKGSKKMNSDWRGDQNSEAGVREFLCRFCIRVKSMRELCENEGCHCTKPPFTGAWKALVTGNASRAKIYVWNTHPSESVGQDGIRNERTRAKRRKRELICGVWEFLMPLAMGSMNALRWASRRLGDRQPREWRRKEGVTPPNRFYIFQADNLSISSAVPRLRLSKLVSLLYEFRDG